MKQARPVPAPVIALHAFVRGTGKSTLAARLAVRAARTHRVGLIDADLGAPSLHELLPTSESAWTINDFLVGACSAAELAEPIDVAGEGCLVLVRASDQPLELVRATHTPVAVEQLGAGLSDLVSALDLDAVIIDVQAGLGGQSLPVLALADTLLAVLRLDQQDYQGTGVTVDVARRLGVPDVRALVNMVGMSYDVQDVALTVESAYGCPTLVVPHATSRATLDDALDAVWRDIGIVARPPHSSLS